MLSRSLKLHQVWRQPQLIIAAASPSTQNILCRFFADDALDPSEKVVLNTKDEAAKGAEMLDKTKGSVKEVGVEAAKAVKRDVERLAEKVGIKEKKPGDLDKTES